MKMIAILFVSLLVLFACAKQPAPAQPPVTTPETPPASPDTSAPPTGGPGSVPPAPGQMTEPGAGTLPPLSQDTLPKGGPGSVPAAPGTMAGDTCTQLSGFECTIDQDCTGTWLVASDSMSCCSVACSEDLSIEEFGVPEENEELGELI
jgi:hypothetical protein